MARRSATVIRTLLRPWWTPFFALVITLPSGRATGPRSLSARTERGAAGQLTDARMRFRERSSVAVDEERDAPREQLGEVALQAGLDRDPPAADRRGRPPDGRERALAWLQARLEQRPRPGES